MYVYALRNPDTAAIKIGCSKNPRERARQLGGKKMELVAVVRGDRTVERVVHDELAPLRISGEWFSDQPEVLDALRPYEAVPFEELPPLRDASDDYIAIRARITDAEWIQIRQEAVTRGMTYGNYTAMLIRAGRECIAQQKEGVA
jgi:hypothetical protein